MDVWNIGEVSNDFFLMAVFKFLDYLDNLDYLDGLDNKENDNKLENLNNLGNLEFFYSTVSNK